MGFRINPLETNQIDGGLFIPIMKHLRCLNIAALAPLTKSPSVTSVHPLLLIDTQMDEITIAKIQTEAVLRIQPSYLLLPIHYEASNVESKWAKMADVLDIERHSNEARNEDKSHVDMESAVMERLNGGGAFRWELLVDCPWALEEYVFVDFFVRRRVEDTDKLILHTGFLG